MENHRIRFRLQKVVEAALAGMARAGSLYGRWSDREVRPWKAPEYLFVAKAAEEIAELRFRPIVLCESNARNAILQSRTKRGRHIKEITKGSRADINIHTRTTGNLMGVIEMKRDIWTFAQIKKDVRRVRAIMGDDRAASSCYFGMIAFTVNSSAATLQKAKDRLETRLRRKLRDRAKDLLGPSFRVEVHKGTQVKNVHTRAGKTIRWHPAALVIRRA